MIYFFYKTNPKKITPVLVIFQSQRSKRKEDEAFHNKLSQKIRRQGFVIFRTRSQWCVQDLLSVRDDFKQNIMEISW